MRSARLPRPHDASNFDDYMLLVLVAAFAAVLLLA